MQLISDTEEAKDLLDSLDIWPDNDDTTDDSSDELTIKEDVDRSDMLNLFSSDEEDNESQDEKDLPICEDSET